MDSGFNDDLLDVVFFRVTSLPQRLCWALSSHNSNVFDKKIDLRDFLIDCSYVQDETILSSLQLKNNLDNLLKKKNKKQIIRKMFIYTILNSFSLA